MEQILLKPFRMFLIFILLISSSTPCSAKKKKTNGKVYLSTRGIQIAALEVAQQSSYTKIHEIDIISHLYHSYKNDMRIVKQKKKIIIPGENFGQAFHKTKSYFRDARQQKKGVFEPKIKLPTVMYQNFTGIALYQKNKQTKMRILLTKAYTQEIPYTFGAAIKLEQDIKGVIRSTPDKGVTEVVFDKDRAVHFIPPGIAFFIPKIFVKIACLRKEGNDYVGYVFGSPVKMPHKFCVVRYNLTTCAKTSIKNINLSPKEFQQKLNDVSYFDFLN
ncbi:MAG: hypothetical protein HQK83_16985 [Fibrobacteria bacterium]|nr:hypothetical protein [Fibrobacteria bacterium]